MQKWPRLVSNSGLWNSRSLILPLILKVFRQTTSKVEGLLYTRLVPLLTYAAKLSLGVGIGEEGLKSRYIKYIWKTIEIFVESWFMEYFLLP